MGLHLLSPPRHQSAKGWHQTAQEYPCIREGEGWMDTEEVVKWTHQRLDWQKHLRRHCRHHPNRFRLWWRPLCHISLSLSKRRGWDAFVLPAHVKRTLSFTDICSNGCVRLSTPITFVWFMSPPSAMSHGGECDTMEVEGGGWRWWGVGIPQRDEGREWNICLFKGCQTCVYTFCPLSP